MGMFIWLTILGAAITAATVTYIRHQQKLRMKRKYEETRAQIGWLNQGTIKFKGAVQENRQADNTVIDTWTSTLIVNESSFDHNTPRHGSNDFGGGGAGSSYDSSNDSSYDSGGGDGGGGGD